jgi:hypothetical protein
MCIDEPTPEFENVPDSRHVLPFMHGDEAHSSSSVLQLKPEKPVTHAQAYSPGSTAVALMDEVESVHTPAFMQGSDEHSSVSTLQLKPVYPTSHWQLYASTASVHAASLLHGEDAHSSTSVSQL